MGLRRTAGRGGAALFVALTLLAGHPGAAGVAVPASAGDEVLEYDWEVKGFFGVIAGLFFPSRGEGVLSHQALPNGNQESQLVITSNSTKEPDYFRYGSEIDPASGATVRVWSSQLWRGKTKNKELDDVPPAAVDIASSIAYLRRNAPLQDQRLEIWSDGKLYPVLVRPMGAEQIDLHGRKIDTRHIAVRPLTEPDRRVWKGELDLWLANDAASTPVEILVSRSPARVLLSLKRYP